MPTEIVTVRQWLDENLPNLYADKGLYKIYRCIMTNWQSARMHAAPDSVVIDADVAQYMDDANYPLEDEGVKP